MDSDKADIYAPKIRSVTWLGVWANALLFALKLVIGIVGGSLAMVADAVHSISDTVTDFAVLIGVKIGTRRPDEKHPYGHGRAETFATVFVAFFLGVVGAAMIYHAASEIAEGVVAEPTYAVLVAAFVSIAVKEFLYRITQKYARLTHSSALYANAWHHRSDAFSSVAVVIGFIALRFGFIYGDQVAAIVVGVMIIAVGAHVISEALSELSETAVDEQTLCHIREIINGNDAVRRWHRLRTRTIGRQVFIDLHILVDPKLNITQAHQISENLEDTLHNRLSRPANVIIHIEPDSPQMRYEDDSS